MLYSTCLVLNEVICYVQVFQDCERPEKTPKGALRKGVRHLHLPFSGLYVELPLIFIFIFVKKKKEKKYTRYLLK